MNTVILVAELIVVIIVLVLVSLVGVNTRTTGKRLEQSLSHVEKELRFNGGSSVKDMVSTLHTAHHEEAVNHQRADFRLQILSDAVDVPLYETDTNAQVIWANESYIKFWHFTSYEEAMSDKWLDHLSPAGRELALSRVASIIRSREPFRFTNTLKSGELIEFIGEPLHREGEFTGWTGSVRLVDEEITETLDE